MKVLIRVDSGNHIGTGHTFRCLNLANELRKIGCEISFVSRSHEDHINNLIEDQNFQLIELESNTQFINKSDSNFWLGASQEQEINDLNDLIDKLNPKLLIIDHYSISQDIESKLNIANIFAIDDIHRKHDAKLILDQNLSGKLDDYQNKSTNNSVKVLTGPKYALLNPVFGELAKKEVINKEINNVLVYFGGTDLTSECAKVVKAYLKTSLKIKLEVVLPRTHKDYQELKKIANDNQNINLYDFVSNMAELMFNADICFGACGVTSWERLSLKKPAFVITSADNQLSIAKSLHEHGYIEYLGDGFKTTCDTWLTIFNKLYNLVDKLNHQLNSSSNECDGYGSKRTAKEVYEYFNSHR